ncbi:hypothetical protein Unana1_05051 [Umbelopsis nana]
MPLPVPKATPSEPGVLSTGDAYHKLQDFLNQNSQAHQVSIDDDHYKKGLVCAYNGDQKKAIVLDLDRKGISEFLQQAGYERSGQLPDSTTDLYKRSH